MRHLKAGRKLGRNASHRRALMRNLARALITHERIITTVEKAKEARRFVEKLITLAKRGDLHARRLALARLPDRETITKLFAEIGPRFRDRPGGYTRIIKRHERRLGDGGRNAGADPGRTSGNRPGPNPDGDDATRAGSFDAAGRRSLYAGESAGYVRPHILTSSGPRIG